MVAVLAAAVSCRTEVVEVAPLSTVSLWGSFDDVKVYAESLDEHPWSAGDDWTAPDFSNVYVRRAPHFRERMLEFIGLSPRLWSPSVIEKRLAKLTEKRVSAGHENEHVYVLRPVPGARLIIITGLHGAFQSLVRYLDILITQKIIDKDFKIIQKNVYIVFNGNTFVGSAYGIDTLLLGARLMEENPSNVVAIMGDEEAKGAWKKNTLGTEIAGTACGLNVPVVSEIIDRFLETFPLALYCAVTGNEHAIDLVKVDNGALDSYEFDEARHVDSFGDQHSTIVPVNGEERGAPKSAAAAEPVVVRVTGERCSTRQAHRASGARVAHPTRATTVWRLESGPVGFNRVACRFLTEAFVVIDTAARVRLWTLTLYSRDIRRHGPLVPRASFNFATGEPESSHDVTLEQIDVATAERSVLEEKLDTAQKSLAACHEEVERVIKDRGTKTLQHPKVSLEGRVTAEKRVVSLGTSVDLTRGAQNYGTVISKVTEFVFDKARKVGTLPNTTINWRVLDDQYSAENAVANVQTLLTKYNTDVIFMPFAPQAFATCLKLVKEHKLVVLFPLTADPRLRSPEIDYAIYFGPSFLEDLSLLVPYVIEHENPRSVVLFAQGGTVEELTNPISLYFEKKNIPVTKITHEKNDVNFEKQLDAVRNLDFDCVGILSPDVPTRAFLRELPDSLVRGKVFFAPSIFSVDSVRKVIEERGGKLISSIALPDPHYSNLPIIQEYRKDMEEAGVDINQLSLSTYLCARIFIEAVKRIPGPITKGALIKSFESMRTFDFGGMLLDFDNYHHRLSSVLWINFGQGKTVKIDVGRGSDSGISATPRKPGQPKHRETTQEVINVGCTLDFTKSEKIMGTFIKVTLEAYFDDFNKDPRLSHGKKVKLRVLDDGYDPERARANVQELVSSYQTDIVLTPLGSPTLARYVDFVKSGSVTVLFPLCESPIFRAKNFKNIVNFGISSLESGAAMYNFATDLHGQRNKIVVFFEATTPRLLDGIKHKLKDRDPATYATVSYVPTDVNFAAQVQKIKEEDPGILMLFCDVTPAMELLRELGIAFVTGRSLMSAVSFLNVNYFKKYCKDRGIACAFVSTVPDHETCHLPIAQDFEEFALNHGIDQGPVAFQTYISARMFTHLVGMIKGPVTGRTLVEAAEKLKGVDLGGITLTFDPATRRLINKFWIDPGSGPWYEYSLSDSSEHQMSVAPEDKGTKSHAPAQLPLKEGVAVSKEAAKVDREGREVIFVGSTLDYTRHLRAEGILIKTTLETYFSELDRDNVLGARTVRLRVLDDGYVPEQARRNVQELRSTYHTNIILTPVGSPTLQRYLDLVMRGDLIVLFPISESPSYRERLQTNIINFGVSGFEEGAFMYRFVVHNYGPRKAALFYLDAVAYNTDGFKREAAKEGTVTCVDIPYTSADVNFSVHAQKIKNESPDVLVIFGTQTAAKEVIRELGDDFFVRCPLVGGSGFTNTNDLKQYCKDRGIRYSVISLVANPAESPLPIAQDFRKFAERNGIAVDPLAFQAYISARIFTRFIQGIDGKVTNEKIIKAAEACVDVDLGGITLSFNSGRRWLINKIWIDPGKGPWQEYSV